MRINSSHTISFFEHQFRSYQDIPAFPQDGQRRDQVLEEIERLNYTTGEEIFAIGYKGLRANAQVGVVRVGEITFEILPKVDDAIQPECFAAHTAARNLLWMLSYAAGIPIHDKDVAGLSDEPSSWFELLTHLFAAGLYREVLSGLTHTYTSDQYTLPVLRGRWDIQRQFTRLRHTRPEFDVIVDEFSADVPLNQIFRWVIEHLYELTQDQENRLLLGELRGWFGQVSLLAQVNPELADQVHFTRLNDRFQPAFNLARLFLSARAIRPISGTVGVYSFTFDMNSLFERFVTALLKRYRDQILPGDWLTATILAQSEGIPVYLAHAAGKPVVRLRPDLIVQNPGGSSPVLIADLKYKLLQPARRGLGLAEEDLYQMLAYATRLNCSRLLLIYPQPPTSGKMRQELVFDSPPVRLLASTINLRRPLSNPVEILSEMREIFHQISHLI